MRRTLAGLLVTLGLLAAPDSGAAEECRLIWIAQVDMNINTNGDIVVPIRIGGQDFNLLVDTGAVFTMLSQDAVTRLGLTKFTSGNLELRAFGGIRVTQYVVAHDVEFGGLKAGRWDISVY